MKAYETLMLAPTEITNDELAKIEDFFEKILSDNKGSLVSFQQWGKYQLPYPVKNNSYGVYVLARYEMPKESCFQILTSITSFFSIKCADFILRSVNRALKGSASAEYIKPDSLDITRSSDLDVLKEKKIENLLDSVDSSMAASAAHHDEAAESTDDDVHA